MADIIDDFTAAARDWPRRPALVHNGTAVTYRELEDRVRLAASDVRAQAAGVSTVPSRIGVLVSHQPAVAHQLLGVLRAQATYCPIDASLPARRVQALTTAMGVEVLVSPTRESRTDFGAELPEPRRRPGDPAYVLCTSGSTGNPKPVMVPRRALTITVRALRSLFALTPADRVLQFASLGWDTCLEEILPALTAGSAVVFDDAAHCGSFPTFVRMLAEQRITVMDLPTAFWHELVLFLHEERICLPDSVRLVIIGGERVDPTRLQQWRDLGLEQVRLLNTYGCTETTMITHAAQLWGPGTEPAIGAHHEAPIGRPLPHVRDHVTDDGELLVSGPGLATGYLDLPELTATAFAVTDHGTGPARWFHTGDLVSRVEGGPLYSHGRADEQLKVLGVRIHPAEVEMQLNSHPAVAGAVVVGERHVGRTSLTAYVVASRQTTAAELKAFLRERLPRQFVPARVNFVAALAYTASGKVDRAATRALVNEDDQGAKR
ncbi:amino acid adenylation domain-containing protein [Mycolicibacterium sp. 018/SC-01/001]|uniref:AMP-binding protein n=1 Tax=Mycolicibacterium sp. 018/SC-01/001 TaxID=2592069 RepID=UPI0011814417|nr:AMP-binding protein [Mycolicibacterium sp. 018/SC-01/001]TRW85390.1 amino acid adenylation domain-containing protein [Mycolicibacterium sp. 018/SC-01/001]